MTLRISGEQIILRDWREADLDAWRRWLQPTQQWHELDGPYYSRPNEQQTDALVSSKRDAIAASDWPEPRRTLVIAMANTDELIGIVSRYWESQETNWLSQGVVIFDPAYWRRGLGFEALGLWSQYLFDGLPEIVRLDLRTWSGNVGMMRLAEKLGYRLEARFRMARIVNGEYYDGLGYGVLRREWETRYPDGFATRRSEILDSEDESYEHPLTRIGRLAVDMGAESMPTAGQRYRREIDER
jgi:putative hydrolase of HD superfamily